MVNGLPLIQVELKRRGIDIREAVNQVMRYKKHSYNGLYHFIQLFIVSNGVDMMRVLESIITLSDPEGDKEQDENTDAPTDKVSA